MAVQCSGSALLRGLLILKPCFVLKNIGDEMTVFRPAGAAMAGPAVPSDCERGRICCNVTPAPRKEAPTSNGRVCLSDSLSGVEGEVGKEGREGGRNECS